MCTGRMVDDVEAEMAHEEKFLVMLDGLARIFLLGDCDDLDGRYWAVNSERQKSWTV